MSTLLIFAGILLLAHAGYSAVCYLRLVEARYGMESTAALPWDIIGELVGAAGLCAAGAMSLVGSFSSLYKASDAPVKCVPALTPQVTSAPARPPNLPMFSAHPRRACPSTPTRPRSSFHRLFARSDFAPLRPARRGAASSSDGGDD